MKKNKIVLSLILVLLLCAWMVVPINATQQDEMIYADELTQNEIYAMWNKETSGYFKVLEMNGMEVLKDSITKVYTVSILDYAKNESFESSFTNDGTSTYVAKVVTDDGNYVSNLQISIKDGKIYSSYLYPTPYLPEYYGDLDSYHASSSYADHANRIKHMLQSDKIFSVKDVRYVIIQNVGEFFLVDSSGATKLIPVGYVSENTLAKTDLVFTEEDLLVLAKEQLLKYNEHIEAKEKWESENPGKEYDVTGYSTEPLISGVSSIDNITNIYDYLGIERLESNSSGFQEVEITSTNDSNSMEWLVWTSMIFLSIVLVFFSVKKIVKINK